MSNETQKLTQLRKESDLEQKEIPLWITYFGYFATVLLVISMLIFFKGILSVELNIREASTLRGAENYIQAIESFRTLYTSSVAEPIREMGIEVTHDYQDKESAIPLPATLSMELGEDIAKNTGEDVVFRLYSKYPFPWRKDGGPRDEFERLALVELDKDKQKSFYRLENKDGKNTLRYAKADIMRASCVQCHNGHPQTPKPDWKIGDVRGVLAVSIPIAGYRNEKTKALHETRFGLIAFSIALFCILIVANRVIKYYIK
ncbi:MAG: Tll0287-like domain-containing protein [Pseudomonadales bacterium]